MAAKSSNRLRWEPLPFWARTGVVVLGVMLLALSFGMLLCPFPTTCEWTEYGFPAKSSRNAADLVTFATACLLAGLALVAYAANGVRLLRFGFGPYNADGSQAADDARDYYEGSDPEAGQDVKVAGEEPQPGEPPIENLETNKGTVSVFELKDVPARVISDALQQWPTSAGSPPASLSEFQFASRKRGKGPQPWILKFQGRPEVRVFYGGRGKSGATVRENDN